MEGLVDLRTRSLSCALIELREELMVEPEKIQALQIQPLMREPRSEPGCTRIPDHPANMRSQHLRLLQLTLLRIRKKRIVRSAAPQEIGQPRCNLQPR